MNFNSLVVGIVMAVLAALLLADGIITYVDPNSQMFSLADLKGIVGVALVVLAASFIKASKE